MFIPYLPTWFLPIDGRILEHIGIQFSFAYCCWHFRTQNTLCRVLIFNESEMFSFFLVFFFFFCQCSALACGRGIHNGKMCLTNREIKMRDKKQKKKKGKKKNELVSLVKMKRIRERRRRGGKKFELSCNWIKFRFYMLVCTFVCVNSNRC